MKNVSENTRTKIIQACSDLINGDINFIEGCRNLVSLRNQFDLEEDFDFFPFVGFASETDDYPSEAIRERFSKDYLKRIDDEVAEYISRIRPSIIEACNILVKKYK